MTWTRALRSSILRLRLSFHAITYNLLSSEPSSGFVVGHVLLVVVMSPLQRRAVDHDADDGRARSLQDLLCSEQVTGPRGSRVDYEQDRIGRRGHVEVVGDEKDRRGVDEHVLGLFLHPHEHFGESLGAEPDTGGNVESGAARGQ